MNSQQGQERGRAKHQPRSSTVVVVITAALPCCFSHSSSLLFLVRAEASTWLPTSTNIMCVLPSALVVLPITTRGRTRGSE